MTLEANSQSTFISDSKEDPTDTYDASLYLKFLLPELLRRTELHDNPRPLDPPSHMRQIELDPYPNHCAPLELYGHDIGLLGCTHVRGTNEELEPDSMDISSE